MISKKQGEEIRSQIFTIEKKGTEELALRAEFTPSFTRMFIERQKQLSKPVKWYAIDKVWRYERPQKGREREFFQFNVEIYGSQESIAEADLIALAVQSMNNLGANDLFEVRINNRKLLQGMLEQFGVEDMDETIRIIDKKLKVPADDFKKLIEPLVKDSKGLLKYLDTKSLEKVKAENDLAKEGLQELKKLFSLLQYTPITFSPFTARGLAYYTGMVFEIFDIKGDFRSLCGGGRYDTLIETYGGEATPALGFGMGFSTLFLFLEAHELIPKTNNYPDMYVGSIEENETAFKIASQLRKTMKVAVSLIKRNVANQLKYANTIRAKNVMIIGPEEVKNKKVKVKDMATGKEKVVSFEDIEQGKI